MIIPSLWNGVLLVLLGLAFLHFMVAGAKTFYSSNMGLEAAGTIAEISFGISGTGVAWWVGLGMPIQRVNGCVAGALLFAALALYEWSRYTIRGRRFGVGLGNHVPEELCDTGPYRRVRHPIYLSYVLCFAAVATALPHWLTLASLAGNCLLFLFMARNDERNIASSALAAAYATYRERTGMFFPRLNSAAPGKPTP